MTIIRSIHARPEHELRREERLYARSCILTSWVICVLLTAVFAWTLRQPPFSFPPAAIQLSAVVVNGLCWWLCTTRIWFKLDRPHMPVKTAAPNWLANLKRLKKAS